MKAEQVEHPQIALRDPATVMRLARMGSFHQSRLSFMRTLLRRLKTENWQFSRPIFDMDVKGVGHAVYTAQGPDATYSLVCFGHDLAPEQRSDRVIAHAWDSTFTLCKGVPSADDIERLRRNVPKQEAGRVTASEVSLSRANRSVRLFEHVVSRLAEGMQPDPAQIAAVGYLMRTTAVYGSGKFGAADHAAGALPFQTEMLAVFLIRAYALDLVEHMAKLRSPDTAVAMDPELRRQFGVGNSTGLGMAPFIVNHPVLLNNWITAREVALARVRCIGHANASEKAVFCDVVRRAQYNVKIWQSAHPIQIDKIADLKADLSLLIAHVDAGALDSEAPWDHLYRWSEQHLSTEGQELSVSMMLEPYGALVDDLTGTMGADEGAVFAIDGAMSVARMQDVLRDVFGWAIDTDWQTSDNVARVWYTSEEKLEPRLGERFEEPIEPYEQPLAPGRDAARFYEDLVAWASNDANPSTLAAFLMKYPQHRHVARRAQIVAHHPYAEIRDNTIAAKMLPIDLLRCKLSFFGATHFDPRSDRWVRITMFQNAPFPHEVTQAGDDDWSYPSAARANACIH